MPGFDIKAFTNAWNTQQTDRILEFYADDAEMVVLPDTEPYRGKNGIRQNLQEVFRGIHDLNGDVEWSVQQGTKAAVLVRISGKHAGPMTVSEDTVIPASNKPVNFKLGIFLDLDANGKIKREVDVVDNITLLESVGALPEIQGAPTGQKTPGTTPTGRR